MSPGYFNSQHKFGRSSLNRFGNNVFSINWQTKKDEEVVHLSLTVKEYQEIKKLIQKYDKAVEERIESITTYNDQAQSRIVFYKTTPKIYYHVKKYLKKHNIYNNNKRRIKHGN